MHEIKINRNFVFTQNLLRSFIILVCFVANGCKKNIEDPIYFKPIFIERFVLENGIKFSKPILFENAVKAKMFNNYLLILDIMHGVHVIDNSNIAEPKKIGLIEIPACFDFEINNNMMYAISATDLISIDIKDISNPKVITRHRDYFDEPLPLGYDFIPVGFEKHERKNLVLVKWEYKK